MLSGAKNVADTLQNDKLHQTLRVNCQLQSRLNCPRIVFAINLADEGRAFQARAAGTGKEVITECRAARIKLDGTISVDVEADRRRRRTSTSVDL